MADKKKMKTKIKKRKPFALPFGVSIDIACDTRGSVQQNAYKKLYNISHHKNIHTSIPPHISLVPKPVLPLEMSSYKAKVLLTQEITTDDQNDDVRIISSLTNFADVPLFPSTPEPVVGPLKIYGFDGDVNKVEEETPPKLSYGFANVFDGEKVILEKLSAYQDRKVKVKAGNPQFEQAKYSPRKSSEEDTVERYIRNLKTHHLEWTQDYEMKEVVARVRRRIDEGSYPNNSVDEQTLPRLLRYVWKGKLNKLKNYLTDQKKHQKINRQDAQGRTALHYAASWACKRTLEELLKVPEIKVDIKDAHDMTPLLKAVETGSLDCVKLLVQSGANAKVTCRDGRNVLDYAIQEHGDERVEIIAHLLNTFDYQDDAKKVKGGRYMHALHKVCLAKKIVIVNQVVDLLIEDGEDVNALEGNGRTPLMIAVMMQRVDIVSCFLQHFADIRHYDDNLKSVLSYAKKETDCYNLLSGCHGNVRVLCHEIGTNKFLKMTPTNYGKTTGTDKALPGCGDCKQLFQAEKYNC